MGQQTTVRIDRKVLERMVKLLEHPPRDEFGVPLYRSRKDIVNAAVKEFLRQRNVKKCGGRGSP
ncbi:MAG: hypothetical protein QXG32_00730 [Candidatus Bathyarchaeia archaeon]